MNGILDTVVSTVVGLVQKGHDAVNSPEGRCAMAAVRVQAAVIDLQNLISELDAAVTSRQATIVELENAVADSRQGLADAEAAELEARARARAVFAEATREELARMVAAGELDDAVCARYEAMTAPAGEILAQADAAAAADDTE